MPWGYAAVAVGSLVAADMQSSAAKDAGKRSAGAADAATAEQQRQFDLTRQDQMPWLNTGRSALAQLAGLYGLDSSSTPYTYTYSGDSAPVDGSAEQRPWQGNPLAPGGSGGAGGIGYEQGEPAQDGQFAPFFASPDYQFALNQGLQGLDRSAAARGGLYSGGHSADVLNYAQGLASQQFNNYANRLAGLAGIGQTTATNLGNLGANTASNIGNIGINSAQQQNQSSYDKANAWSNFGNQLAGLAGQYFGSRDNTTTPTTNTANYWQGGNSLTGGTYTGPWR